MGRYLLLWEADETKIPLDPTVRRESWLAACEMVKKDIERGLVKDWGVLLGQTKGFAIDEGTEEEVAKMTLKYIPTSASRYSNSDSGSTYRSHKKDKVQK